jgi:molybdate transport system substrate-binding protein
MFFTVPALADDQSLILASGGGYKKMVNALAKAYEAETGNSLQLIYGNMGRVTAQAKTSGAVDMVLGAEFFFKRAELSFKQVEKLGQGRLVLAWSKAFKSQNDAKTDLQSKTTKRIALPDTQKAIYGRASQQYLQRTGLLPELQDKLLIVATVPQVFSYLSINEVDLGFLNLTHALNVKHSLGGYSILPEGDYDPINIVVGEMNDAPHSDKTAAFFHFLASEKARKIIRNNGL